MPSRRLTLIVSCSYKTDVPTFYAEWFLNRLRAGYCLSVNPYGGQIYRVNLKRDAVDGFVFWTKNVGPFLPGLQEVAQRGYPFVIQYTINGYPRSLESAVVDAERSVAHVKLLCRQYGSEVAVWRYDTIVFTSATPIAFHLENFERLAAGMEGSTNEVVISYVQLYSKTRRNMELAADAKGFEWHDPEASIKCDLTAKLSEIARRYGMQLAVCSQNRYLSVGASEARCVDIDRLSRVAGYPIVAPRKANRPECGCYAARDIGEYDTCPHGCVYCYAVQNQELAQARFRRHDPLSEFLFEPENNSHPPDHGEYDLIQGALF